LAVTKAELCLNLPAIDERSEILSRMEDSKEQEEVFEVTKLERSFIKV
jgi:hypothetical protein